MTLAAEVVLRLVGLFYVLSGVLVVRSLAVSALADSAYTAIMGRAPSRAERVREIWLGAGSVVIGAGGLALALLMDLAVPLFVLGAVQQGVYLLIVAPRFLDPVDAPDPAGRAKTVNAAVVYAAVTVAVVLAAQAGLLHPWYLLPNWLLAMAGGLVLFGAGWTAMALRPKLEAKE